MDYPDTLPFTTDPAFAVIDELARQAAKRTPEQSRDWLFTFHTAMQGWGWRLYGVALHYRDVHAWGCAGKIQGDEEYHIASILFNMDSALECLCFALNALGHAEDGGQFASVRDERALRRFSPRAVLEEGGYPGFPRYYPSFTALWRQRWPVIQSVIDHHDVSKHRVAQATGGSYRLDAPPGFPALDAGLAAAARWMREAPFAKLLLRHPPKEPLPLRFEREDRGAIALESLCLDFTGLMNETAARLPADIRSTFASARE